MDMGLTGKVAWVTGATGAIGREIALSFAREGARVAVSARTEEAVASLVDEIKSAGGDAMAAAVDVTDPDAVKSATRSVIDGMGCIDVLAATVAVPAFGPFLEIDGDVFRQALEVKYLGYINCFEAVPVSYTHLRAHET